MTCGFGPCGRGDESAGQPGMVFLNGEFVCKLCDIVAHLPQPVFRKGEQVEGVKKGKRGDFLLR